MSISEFFMAAGELSRISKQISTTSFSNCLKRKCRDMNILFSSVLKSKLRGTEVFLKEYCELNTVKVSS